MYKYLVISIILVVFLESIILFKTPNNVLMIYGLLEDRSQTSEIGNSVINIVPKRIAVLKVKAFDTGCHADFDGIRINYVTMFSDIVFNHFSGSQLKFNKNDAKKLVLYFAERGCAINEVHPETGMAPIHSAVLGASDDYNFALDIVRMGGDLSLVVQGSSYSSVEGKTAIEIVNLIIEKGESPYISLYKNLLKEIDG